MLSDIENTPSAKATVKATAIAHAAITGSCLRDKEFVILAVLQSNCGPADFEAFLGHLLVLGKLLDPRETPPKSKVNKAKTFMRQRSAVMFSHMQIVIGVLYHRLFLGGMHLASKCTEVALALPADQKNNWPADMYRQVRDQSGATFVISAELLSPYRGCLGLFCEHLIYIADSHKKFAQQLPPIFAKLCSEKRVESFLPALNRMSEREVHQPANFGPLALAPVVRKIGKDTDLGKIYWEALKRLDSEIKTTKKLFSWGK